MKCMDFSVQLIKSTDTLNSLTKFPLKKIAFLDTLVYKDNRFQSSGMLDLKTFTKETETYQYLDRTSCHPKSVFKGFIKSEIIRHTWNTSDEN